MKKIILLVLCAIICFSLMSCNYGDNGIRLPTYSENFDENFASDFFEYYYERDPNLFCLTSSAWEIGLSNDEARDMFDVENYYISTIDNTDKSLYVAVTEHNYIGFMGTGHEYSMSHIYQHVDAPDPMEDWNIISAELYFDDSLHLLVREVINKKKEYIVEILNTYMKDNISCAELVKKYEDGSSLSAISESYARCSTVRPSRYERDWDYFDGRSYNYCLVLRFEENDNIVWGGEVFLCDEGVFIRYSINEKAEEKSVDNKYLILNGELGKDIRDQIIAHSGEEFYHGGSVSSEFAEPPI